MADEDAGLDEQFEDDTAEDEEDVAELDGPDEDFDEEVVFVEAVEDDDFEGDAVEEVEEEADEEDEDDDERAARVRKRKADEEEDDDDEMLAPDDVEADLDAILKDRMVTTAEDDEDDEDEPGTPDERGEGAEGLQPKRADEQLCNNCFLLVRANAPGCPIEDDNCPIFG